MGSDLRDGSRVLITGASGFIGTNLLQRFLDAGVACTAFDLQEPRNPDHRQHWQQGDLRDEDSLRGTVSEFEPTHVIHLGARTDMEGHTVRDYSSNTIGVESIVAAANDSSSVTVAVFASSRLVTPVGYVPQDDQDVCPDTPYGESKALGENIVRNCMEKPWVIVRPTSIWGPWFGVPYRQFFDNVRRRTYVHPRGLRVMKTFGYVDNTTDQIEAIAFDSSGATLGKTLYLGDPPIEVGEFADLVAGVSEVKRPPRVPMRLLTLAAKVGDLGNRLGLLGRAPLTSSRLSNLSTDMVFDLEATLAVAGPPCVPVEEGVRRTVEWLDRPD